MTRLENLLMKYSDNAINAHEFEELCGLLKKDENEAIFKKILENDLATAKPDKINKEKLDVILINVLQSKKTGKLVSIKGRWYKTIAAAVAGVIIVLGYLFLEKNHSVPPKAPIAKIQHDVQAPDEVKAKIRLADGRLVPLDSIENGLIASQLNVNIVKNSKGEIVYQPISKDFQQQEIYNTLENPMGSKVVNLKLNDGTKVWLNTGSSITYPVFFVGKTRNVTITGEAYFEVVHNDAKPFFVKAGNQIIEDLGTAFNVNAYPDEPGITTTLVEGAINIKSETGGKSSHNLSPGQNARLQQNGEFEIGKDVNISEAIAWKDGNFYFRETELKEIMRQVQRWYNVEIVFEGNMGQRFFTGEISKDKSLTGLMKILELSKINFRIEGKKLTIKP